MKSPCSTVVLTLL